MAGHWTSMRQASSMVGAVPKTGGKPVSRDDNKVCGESQAPVPAIHASGVTSHDELAGPSLTFSTPTFTEAYEAHFDFVWRSARRLGVPEASLDDVVQDVFVTVYRRLSEFEGRSLLRTWMFGILRHTVRDLRRTQRRKPTEAFSHEPESHDGGPHEATVQREGTRLLHEVLDSLDDDHREVFVLAELEQMSAPEIGLALELNVNTVYSRLRAARQSFEAALKRLRSREQWMMRSGGCDE